MPRKLGLKGLTFFEINAEDFRTISSQSMVFTTATKEDRKGYDVLGKTFYLLRGLSQGPSWDEFLDKFH